MHSYYINKVKSNFAARYGFLLMSPVQFSKPVSRMFVPTGTKEHLIAEAGCLQTANIRNGFSATTNVDGNSGREDVGKNISDYTISVCFT